MIRNAAKALLIKEGKILLNRCKSSSGEIYYDLPGGGQHLYETMEQAVCRECLEETGLTVRILRFAALSEEISTDPSIRERYPDYAHRILHIFVAEPLDLPAKPPSELDLGMEESVWVPLAEADRLPLRPAALKGRVQEAVRCPAPLYLGTEKHP